MPRKVVAALARDNVWAVGQTGYANFQPPVEKWNGTAWELVKTLQPQTAFWVEDPTSVPDRHFANLLF